MTMPALKDHTSLEHPELPKQALFYLGVFTAFLGASSAPTPLYPLYQSAWGFSSTLLTLVFAVYMFALLAALLVSGSLSDHWGRKPVTSAAIVIELLSLVAFLLANGPAWLIVGRVLQGFATGIMTSAVVAAILDSDARRGPLIASIAPFVAMAFGALFAGLLVSYAPAPMRLVYALLLVALLLQLAWLPKMTETVTTKPASRLSLRPHVHIPARARATLLRVVTVSIAAWMLGGFALSLGPSLVISVIGLDNPVMGALPISLLGVVGTLTILVLRQRSPHVSLLVGGWGLSFGLGLLLIGVYSHATWLLLLGATVGGAGFGAGFTGVMRTITSMVAASERSAAMATLYVIWYLAASVPALIAGMATDNFGLESTAYVYVLVIIVLAAMALVGMGIERTRGTQSHVCPNT